MTLRGKVVDFACKERSLGKRMVCAGLNNSWDSCLQKSRRVERR